MIPISLGMTLLQWSGAAHRVTAVLGPAFPLVGLPHEASLAFLGGAFVNCYTGIAAMGSLALTSRQVTILSLMILIAHNLVLEVSVQRRAGSTGWRILLLRLVSCVLSGVFLNLVLPADGAVLRAAAPPPEAGASEALSLWLRNSGVLTAKVVVLVTALMIVQRLLRQFGGLEWLARVSAPLLAVLGLPRRAAFLWIVANVLGLAYGAGVIVEEIRAGALDARDAELLNLSIAVCHSLFEDTLLFVAVGAAAFWITVPRLVLAALVVWSHRGWRRLTETRA